MKVLGLAIRRSRVPVLVNVSHSTIEGAIALAENAIDSGVAGVLLMPPYFYRYTDDQIFSFYKSFVAIAAGKIRTYLYNLPFFTNPISPDLAVRLLGSGWFAGIKDSSGDWALFEALKNLREKVPFTLLMGSESLYLRGRLAGANGIVSGVAAAMPELLVAIDKAMARTTRPAHNAWTGDCKSLFNGQRNFPPPSRSNRPPSRVAGSSITTRFRSMKERLANLNQFREWVQAWIPAVLAECREAGARESVG